MFLTRSELGIFMNNLLLYFGLADARISASEKDLPVLRIVSVHFLEELRIPKSSFEIN